MQWILEHGIEKLAAHELDLVRTFIDGLSDVPGLMRDPTDPQTLISHLKLDEVDALKKAGIVEAGMIPKLDSAVAAIRAGVDKVSLVDGRVPHAVLLEIFTDAGVGTEVVR